MNAEDMALLRLRPGDILVVQFPDRASAASADALDKSIREMLDRAGHKQVEVLILMGGGTLTVMREHRPEDDLPDESVAPSRTSFIGRLIDGLKRRNRQ
jgi:hypothetical protein